MDTSRKIKTILLLATALGWMAEALPGSPKSLVVETSLDRGRPRLDVVGGSVLNGQTVTVTSKDNEKIVATAVFEPRGTQAGASLLVPFGVFKVSAPGWGKTVVDCTGFEGVITRKMDEAVVLFNPSVFGGDKFPACDLERRVEVEQILGSCELRATFYDSEYREVKVATTPGRYGAIVEVKIADGRTFKRFITLFRTAHAIPWSPPPIHVSTDGLSAALGLDPTVLQERSETVDDLFAGILRWSMGSGYSTAAVCAGLSELKPGSPIRYRNGPDELDRAWWYGLKKLTGNLRSDYYVHLPSNYDADAQKKWPLILFLHGMGNRGSNLKNAGGGLLQDLAKNSDFPFMVIAPQCPAGEWWSNGELLNVLDLAELKYRVDPRRVYLTGLSMGGFGSWALAIDSPKRFAAVVPICGGGDAKDADRIKDLPIWVFHGEKDGTVPFGRSEEMVEALLKLGSEKVKFTRFPEAGHDSWTAAYSMPELYEWLLQQELP